MYDVLREIMLKVLTVNTSSPVVLDLAVLSGTTLAQTAGVDTLAVLTGLLGWTLTAAATSNSCKYQDQSEAGVL